jgi:hypothetical protein
VKKFQIFLAVGCLTLNGCAAYGMAPVNGILMSDVRGPLAVTAYPTATKTGEATCSSVLGLISSGDCSIEAASKKAGITRIHSDDYHSKSTLGIIASFTVIVHGDE